MATALVLGWAARAGAQELPAGLSLNDAMQLALGRNPTLAAALDDVAIAEADRLQASRRPNPALTINSEGYPLPGGSGAPPSFFGRQEFVVRADQELEMAGRRQLRMAGASASAAVARSLLANERRRLTLDVQRAYLQTVLARADLDVSQVALADIDRMLGIAKARLDQGEIAGGEFRRLQVERLRFVDDQLATDLAFKNAKAALLAVMGFTELGRDFEVTGRLTELPVALSGSTSAGTTLDRLALERQALAARPDLIAARGEQQRADAETQLQRKLRTPNVTIGAGYKRTQLSNGVAFGATIPLPLVNRNPGGIARADAEQRRAVHRSHAAELTVRLEVQQAVNAFEAHQARVRYIEHDTLAAAREARDAVMAAYQVGEAGLIDYLDAQRSFRETLRIYNRALYERRLSDFAVAAAVGHAALQP